MLSFTNTARLAVKPTAKVPAKMIRIVRKVRVLLPQKSAQTFFQRLLMLASSHGKIILFVLVCHLMQGLTGRLGQTEQLVELVIPDGQHFHRSTLGSADRRPPLTLMEERHFAEEF